MASYCGLQFLNKHSYQLTNYFCSGVQVYEGAAVDDIQGHIDAGEGSFPNNRLAAWRRWNYIFEKKKKISEVIGVLVL